MSDPSPKTAHIEGRGSLRFQLSLVLLLSALNGVAVVVYAVAFISTERGLGPGAQSALQVLLVWVVLSTAVSLFVARGLRRLLTLPLARLAAAADEVTSGKLDMSLPDPGGAPELRAAGRALEHMRQRLASMVVELDSHNAVRKSMLDSLADGVIFLDERHHIAEINPRGVEILDSLVGRARRRPILTAPIAALLPELNAEVLGRAPLDRLPLLLESGGRRQHLELGFQHIGRLPGVGRGAVLVLRDVTQAVEVDSLKRDFLSLITHELKTPLTVINGYLRLLLMGKAGDLKPRQADLVQKSLAQGRMLLQMIQDLLDTTRLEGGNLTMELVPVDARTLVEELRGAWDAEALMARIQFAVEVPEAPLPIQVDPFRLRQVLSNLLRNAFKFTAPGGRVVVRALRGEVGDAVLIEVQDTGRGIPQHAIPNLFRKFYQVEQGDTRNAGGAGLGLYICEMLMKAMAGSIQVESEVGVGSTFRLSVPRLAAVGRPVLEFSD